jgi:pyruvate carboxylase
MPYQVVTRHSPREDPLKRAPIANRGEIALRVMRAFRNLKLETVAAYPQADFSTASSFRQQLLAHADLPNASVLARPVETGLANG